MHFYELLQLYLADFELDLEFIHPFCHIVTDHSHILQIFFTCIGLNQKKTEDKDMRQRLGIPHLLQGAVCGVKPRTDPLVAELLVAFGVVQIAS